VIEGKAAAEVQTEVTNTPAVEPMVFSPDED